MARDPILTTLLYGVLGVAGYQLAVSGTFGPGARTWATTTWSNVKTSFGRGMPSLPAAPGAVRGGAGQSQSSGTAGGSPSSQAAPSGQNQQQPSSITIIRDNTPGTGNPGTDPVGNFVNQYGLDPTDRTSPWVNYYRQQYGSWPDDDLLNGNADPAGLYSFAVAAISYLQAIGAM